MIPSRAWATRAICRAAIPLAAAGRFLERDARRRYDAHLLLLMLVAKIILICAALIVYHHAGGVHFYFRLFFTAHQE